MIPEEEAKGVALPPDAAPRPTRVRGLLGISRRTAATFPADPDRTREKVLRIVFQPYIDERGRLHEKSAIHAVVASGEWQQSLAQTVPSNARLDYALGVPESLADAVDRVDPPGGSPGVGDPARSEEHTSELQSLMRISYAVFCLKK